MGDWTITVHGTGAHHNKDYPGDADRLGDDLVRRLREAGQTVHSASFTHGARQKLMGQPAETPKPPKAKSAGPTIFKLTWGAGGHVPEQVRFFSPIRHNDAIVRFSERVLAMDRDPAITAAYARLERLPDTIYPEGMYILGWTKTSDERPTAEGAETEAEAQSMR